MIVDHVWMQVISASRPEWIVPFTGLEPGQFRKLVRLVAQRGGEEIDGQCAQTVTSQLLWFAARRTGPVDRRGGGRQGRAPSFLFRRICIV